MKNSSTARLRDTALVNSDEEKRSNSESKTQHGFFENLKWLTAKEAAFYLRLSSVECLRNLVCKGKIPRYYLGRSLRFKVTDLDRVLEASTNQRR